MLSDVLDKSFDQVHILDGLNAPFGARCFLTIRNLILKLSPFGSLNAPFGARCFLTVR